jgi:DNA-binding MarR family transcriptional regulator
VNKVHNEANAITGRAGRGRPSTRSLERPGLGPGGGAVAALDRLWGLSLLLGDLMQQGLAERGMTLARAAVVVLVDRQGASTQRALSRSLRVTPRNITGLVDALEEEGLVVRAPHPSDRRATLVTLTRQGSALARALRRDQDGFAGRLFGDVDPAELSAFTRVLDRVLVRIEERLGPPR